MISAEVAVIGAGLAGAATAYFLTREGVRDLVILERESVPGMHASGRNAGMIRRRVGDPALDPCTAEGTGFLAEPPPGFPRMRRTGSILLDPPWRTRGVRALVRERLEEWIPLLAGGAWRDARFEPRDGLVDPHAVLSAYLDGVRRRGGRIVFGARVEEFRRRRGRLVEARTRSARVRASVFVNAAGAWARTVADLAGARGRPVHPYRRHLILARTADGTSPEMPFVWHLGGGVYFRPEGDALLMSPCDETRWRGGRLDAPATAVRLLAEKVRRTFPRLESAAPLRVWACLRTLAPDRRFVIGGDPDVPNLVWAAGLGGHGLTASAAVGRLAARAVLFGGSPESSFRPGRLCGVEDCLI